MAWTTPPTAHDGDDFVANWENADRDNTKWVVRPVFVLPNTVEAVNVTRDVETDLLGGLGTVPGGILGTKGMLRVTILVDIQNADHSDTRFQYRLRIGSVEVWNSTGDDTEARDRRHPSLVKFYVCCCGSASSTFAVGYIKFGGAASAAVTGLGPLGNNDTVAAGPYIIPFGSAGKLSTIDTSVDQLVQFTFASNHQDQRLSVRSQWAVGELVGYSA